MYQKLHNIVILCVALFQVASAQEETLCRGQKLNMTTEQKSIISDCLTETKVNSVFRIPQDKLSCFGVCIFKKKGLLTGDGKLNHEKIFAYVEVVMKPDEIKKPLKEGIDKCFKEHGEKIVDDNDPKCMTYMETGQCVHDIFFELCFTE